MPVRTGDHRRDRMNIQQSGPEQAAADADRMNLDAGRPRPTAATPIGAT
jgi:hypothetical protein